MEKCNCFDCPYGEVTYGEDTYSEMTIWCEKVGERCSKYGYCEYAFEDIETENRDKTVKPNVDYPKYSRKKDRRERYQTKLKRIYDIKCGRYLCPVGLIEEKWDKDLEQYVPLHKPYYQRYYKGNHLGNRYRFYKKHSNKVVRRYKGDLNNGNYYRKVFDYWWTVD